jgi:NAD(P)-dependent dehydrogenase (short-subunit alcohol dehydrogenase family)
MPLNDKIVLITGGARRIGRSLGLAAARAGAVVAVHYGESHLDADDTLTQIEAWGGKAFLLQADLSDPLQVMELIPRALEHGRLYALINNAAVFEPLTWKDTSLEDWNHNLMVNLTAPFLLSRAFAQSLHQDETGRIINLLDWRALRPGADHFPYTVSKSALAALTRSMAVALAPQITVNGLALGAILPPGGGEADRDILKKVPAGRWAALEEVAQAMIFLLEGPAYITGEIIHVDGGRHLV